MVTFSPVILIHILTALLAVLVGAAVFLVRKGTPAHRLLGRSWVFLMATTALVSFAIQTKGHLSWIHLLSTATLFWLVKAIVDVRRGKLQSHLRIMRGTYVGLVLAGLFTLLPQRLLGQLLAASFSV